MTESLFDEIITFIRGQFPGENRVIPLHEPCFSGNEEQYLADCIRTGYVSSVGNYVGKFEAKVVEFTGSMYAIAVMNGSAGLHLALKVAGIEQGDEVITQPLSFVATSNAIVHAGACPVFLDVDSSTMGLSSERLEEFLLGKCIRRNGTVLNKVTGRKVKVCLPMHTFGHPCEIERISELCSENNIILIEDAAESIGSFYKNKHTGSFGLCGVISFNGNKTITTGGGGMIITSNSEFAERARHLSTQAKVPHQWDFFHDEAGYNYRLTNIQAAIGLAQMEQLPLFIESKRKLAEAYRDFFASRPVDFFTEPENARSNFWLNTLIFSSKERRDAFLKYTNERGISTRPAWTLLNRLPMFSAYTSGSLHIAEYLSDRIVNIPSSVRIEK